MSYDNWNWWQDWRDVARQSDHASWRDDWSDRWDFDDHRGWDWGRDWGHGHDGHDDNGGETPDDPGVPDPIPDPDTGTDPSPDPTPTPDPIPGPDPTPDPVPDPSPDPTPDPIPDPVPDPDPDPAPDPGTEPNPIPPPRPEPVPVPEAEQMLLDLINNARAEAGVAPLTINSELNAAADAHTAWMLDTDNFSHDGAGGSDPGNRIEDAGYDARTWGENIAWRSDAGTIDEADVQRLHQQLMDSPGHRENILNPAFHEVGLGLADGEFEGKSVAMLTEDFGTGRGGATAPAPTPGTDPAPEPIPDPDPVPDQPVPEPDQPVPEPEPEPVPLPPSSGGGATVNGLGNFNNEWGVVDHSVPGQVTVVSRAGEWFDAGFMYDQSQPLGYGHYEFTVSMNKDVPGGYALLWPGNDVWPGAELDVLEVLADGTAYSNIHYNDNGNDAYESHMMPGVDVTQTHVYGLTWEAGRLTGYVDGQQMWTTTNHVPVDAAHGGLDLLPSVGAQTWWNIDLQGGTDHRTTLYDFSYTAIG